MKNLTPVVLALLALAGALTIAILNANNLLVGKARLLPWLYGACVFLFLLAVGLFIMQAATDDPEPLVAPVRYGTFATSARQIDGRWYKPDGTPFTTEEVLRAKHLVNLHGLVVVSESDPAYELSIGNRKVGTSTAVFGNRIPRLAARDGEGFFPINMELANGSGLLGGLPDEMKTQDVLVLPIKIKYRNSKRNRFKTTCKIVRDVTQPHGLAIRDVNHGRDLFGFLRRD
jgi:hypothetical protein